MKTTIQFLQILTLLFSYTIYAQTQIGNTILGEDTLNNFGASVSISSNGDIIAIGAPNNDGNGSNSGHVRVFAFDGSSTWNQIGNDIDGEALADISGYSVSLAAFGGTVVIGSPNSSTNGSYSGSVRIFTLSTGNWVQLGGTINGTAGSQYGSDVAISDNGLTVAIGAPWDSQYGNASGKVQVFTYSNNEWVQKGSDISGENNGDLLGSSVALSGNGNILAVGAKYNDDSGNLSGHVKIYEYSGGNWVQRGSNIDGEAANDQSGYKIAMSNNGNIIAIGAPYNDGNGSNSGHVRVYQYSGGNWVQMGTDIDGENAGDISGQSVALSSNGQRVAIGAAENSENGTNSGQIRIYEFDNGNWAKLGDDINGTNSFDKFGFSIGLSSDGNTVITGAPFYDENLLTDVGQVKLYDLSGATLGVNENLLSNAVKLYPNPTSNKINIQLDKNSQLEKITIYNQLGQYVNESDSLTIDMSSYTRGVYYAEIATNKGKTTKKIIVE